MTDTTTPATEAGRALLTMTEGTIGTAAARDRILAIEAEARSAPTRPDLTVIVDRWERRADEGLPYGWLLRTCAEEVREALGTLATEEVEREWQREHAVHLNDDELFRDCPLCVAEVESGKARWPE